MLLIKFVGLVNLLYLDYIYHRILTLER